MTTHLRGPRGLTLPNQTSRSPGSKQPVPRLWGPSYTCCSRFLCCPPSQTGRKPRGGGGAVRTLSSWSQ